MRNKIITALENSIDDYTGDNDTLLKFINEVSTHSLYTLLTPESLDGIMNYIYNHDQDNILDFIQIVNHNLIISDVDITVVIDSIIQYTELYNTKIVNDVLIKLLNIDINTVNKYNIITIIYLLKIYSKTIIKICFKKQK